MTIAGLAYQVGKAQTNQEAIGIGVNYIADLSDFGRAIPILGVFLSLGDAWDQVFNHGFYTEDVYKRTH